MRLMVPQECLPYLRSARSALQLTADGARRLQEFRNRTARSLPTAHTEQFVDGDGAESGFAAFSDPTILQRFVEYVGVRPGACVVEVGAGTGRLTFEGGLASAVGPDGLLLVTDPAFPLLRVLEGKLQVHGGAADQVHALVALAESLPVADDQADVVMGSKFLQYCDPVAAIREMRRAVRPAGLVAVLVGLPVELGPGWKRVAAPLVEAARRHGSRRSELSLYFPPGEVAGRFAAAGLEAVRQQGFSEEVFCADAERMVRFVTQLGFFEGFVADVPEAERRPLLEAAYRDLRAMLAGATAERAAICRWEAVVGRKPGRP